MELFISMLGWVDEQVHQQTKQNKPAYIPIIFREDLCTIIKTTLKSKGLSKVSEKLFKEKKNDNL